MIDKKNDPFSKPRKCRYCDNMTSQNPVTGRYGVLCGRPECSQRAREAYKVNMENTYGTHNIMNIPEMQVRMAKGRAKQYRWSNSQDTKYCLSGNELNMCAWLEQYGFKSDEVVVGEMVLAYKYLGAEKHHIVDFFIPTLNLIISVKDSIDNPNTRPNVIADRAKNAAQYKHIIQKTDYSFIQIEGNGSDQYDKLRIMLSKLEKSPKNRITYKPVIDFITENLLVVEYNHFETYIMEGNEAFSIDEDGMRNYISKDDVIHNSMDIKIIKPKEKCSIIEQLELMGLI